jgi:hypothetical protein
MSLYLNINFLSHSFPKALALWELADFSNGLIQHEQLSKKNPEKYRKVYINNTKELNFYIEQGEAESGVPLNDKLPFFNWEVLNTELSIPCNYYEMDAQASFVEKSLLDLGKLSICLSYGYYLLVTKSYKLKRFTYRFSR